MPFNDACASECQHSKVKVQENGRSAVFCNNDEVKLQLVKVDGCLEIEGSRADFVIEKGDCAIIIELKGRDVEHGADQVHATANLWVNSYKRCQKIAGLIVAKQYPRSSSSIQLKQQAFSRRWKGPLHVVTKELEFEIENLLSYKGPLKR